MLRLMFPILLLALAAAPAPAQDEHEPMQAPHFTEAPADDHGEAGRHEERGLVDPQPSEAAYTIVVFLLFFGVLSFVVWPRILKALQAREDKQRTDLTRAEAAAASAEKTLVEYKQQLADARKEAQRIIEHSRTDAQRIAAQVAADAEARARQTVQRAQSDIAAAREQAIASIYEQAASISTQIAGQILGREIDPAAHQALVNDSLEQLSTRRN